MTATTFQPLPPDSPRTITVMPDGTVAWCGLPEDTDERVGAWFASYQFEDDPDLLPGLITRDGEGYAMDLDLAARTSLLALLNEVAK